MTKKEGRKSQKIKRQLANRCWRLYGLMSAV